MNPSKLTFALQLTIWKFEIEDRLGLQKVEMPQGAKLLRLGCQWPRLDVPRLTVWAVVNPTRPLVDRQLALAGTGQPFPDQVDPESAYVWTEQIGPIVYHLFDLGEVEA